MTQAAAELVLVDTSAWICHFAKSGHTDIKTCLAALLDEDKVAIAGPIVLELLQGCRSDAEMKKLIGLFLGLHWLRVEDEIWCEAGRMAFRLRRLGVTIGAVDAVIATIATTYQCVLLHCDSDFTRIALHTDLQVMPPFDV